ncbi:EamA family transporter [Methanobacterium sp. ACI-7]|uniref:EamA family transporter n=1 Tax=unclassified Methanobacterium TaxID=2627676 RepID=UPI0039C0F798
MIASIFAFLAAFFESVQDVFSKKGLKAVDEYIVSFSLRLFSLPFLIIMVLISGIPNLGSNYLIALIIDGLLNLVTIILYLKAIKVSDLSIAVPLIAFTPLFLLVTSPLILGEIPDPIGVVGVLLIVFGSYLLNITKVSNGILGPFKALFKARGPKLMLIVAFLFSITSNIDKIGVQNSSPIFWAFSINIFVMIVTIPLIFIKSDHDFSTIKTDFKSLFPIGFFSALAIIFQMIAINLTLVAYVISIKRISAVFGVLWGKFIFKERGIKERLIGTLVMVLGVALITLSQILKF